ncbi:uncharacterized protein RCO7_06173 [Rhynchosporium graminicola]|uniref:Uncharacterized protein n=1 Tax=Rhynchosporium graminicola TaxID=2792576 RepID=A0A1E1KYR2_9HELO|nr:uncharacterized protein RCO7_06173 [Rhynchosporium commune]
MYIKQSASSSYRYLEAELNTTTNYNTQDLEPASGKYTHHILRSRPEQFARQAPSMSDNNRYGEPRTQQSAEDLSKDTEMSLDSCSIAAAQPTASPSGKSHGTKDHSKFSATAKTPVISKVAGCEEYADIQMNSESQTFMWAPTESHESRADHPVTSTKAQPSSKSIISVIEASDSLTALPTTVKARHELYDVVRPRPQQAPKIPLKVAPGAFRGISSMIADETIIHDDRKTSRRSGPGKSTFPKDVFSYAIPVTSPVQQAKREVDFIGSADYYDVRYDEVQQSMGGTYLIVYSRDLDQGHEPCGEYEVYPVSYDNRITVLPTGAATPVQCGKKSAVFHKSKNWAEGEVDFNNRFYTFWLQPRWSSDGIQAACKLKQEFPGESPQTCLLDQTLDTGVNGGLISTARFGSKYMRTDKPWSEDRSSPMPDRFGFKFIALDLGTWAFTTGDESFRRVIGVKIPDKKDVASGFLLNQRVTWHEYGPEMIHVTDYRPASIQAPKGSQRKQEKDVLSRDKRKTWADQVEADERATIKDRKKTGNDGGVRMIRDDELFAGLRRR